MRSKKRVTITKQDIKLFHYLFRYRAATSWQIHRDIYSEYKNISVTRSRLLRLKKANLIQNRYRGLEDRQKAYGVTKIAAIKYINVEGGAPLWRGTYCPLHDIELLDIWKSINDSPELLSSYSENEYNNLEEKQCQVIRVKSGMIKPDGIIEVQIGDTSFTGSLEFERTRKTRTRYLELLDKYYRNDYFKYVLYICDDKSIYNLVRKCEADILTPSQKPKLFYAIKQDILTNSTVTFKNINNQVIRLTGNVSPAVCADFTRAGETAQTATEVIESREKQQHPP